MATLALLATMVAPLPAHADATYWNESDLDELVEDYVASYPEEDPDEDLEDDDPGIPGISVAVVQDGDLIYSSGFGHADIEDDKEATAKSVYNIASVSKPVGGTLAAKLEADPSVDLNLDAPTSDYLPRDGDGELIDSIHEDHDGSHTLRQLLTHLACVPHYTTDPGIPNTTDHFPSDTAAGEYVWTESLIQGWGDDNNLTCTVGEDEVYSTPAFTLLGAAMEEATGENINDLLHDELFKDFGLDSMRSQFGEDDELPSNDHRVVPYHRNRDDVLGFARDWPNSTWKRLGGGIESNVEDLAMFGWLVLDGEIVSEEVRDKLWTVEPGTSSRGLGWRAGTTRHDRPIAWHGGLQNVGARAELRVFRDEGLVVAVLANRGRFSNGTSHSPNRLANDIADAVLYTPPELTVDSGQVTVDEGGVAENQGTVSTAVSAEITDIEASVGDVDEAGDNWSWSWQTADGPDESQEVTITVTDDEDEQDTVTFDLVVENVAPTVEIVSPTAVQAFDEGDEVTIEAEFTDPGWKDTHDVTIDWDADDHPGDVVEEPSFEIVEEGGPGLPRRGVVTGTFQYGDNDDGDGFDIVVTVEDDDGGVGDDTINLTVNNVDPTVTVVDVAPESATIDEGDEVTIRAEFTDPGWLEDLEVDIEWGVHDDHPGMLVDESVTILEEGGPGPTMGEVTATYQYGDTDMGQGFEVDVTVEDKDGGVGSDEFILTVENVDPTIEDVGHGHDTVELAEGGDAILTQSGDPLQFDVQVTDPGSDDLVLDADFDDDTTDSWESLVNDPDEEPVDVPSPTVDPRDETFTANHTYADACFYQATFTAEDDDGGVSEVATIDVIVTGTAGHPRSAGYWMTEYRQRGRSEYTPDTLECFLDIVGQLSEVFHDDVDAAELDDAADVLHPGNSRGRMTVQFDRQLLTAWANFASGAIGHDQLVDTTGDAVADTPFREALADAEEARLDSDATRAELEDHKDILEQINTG